MIETPLECRRVTRRQGEALHPEREPLAILEQIRQTIGEYNFAGQYQQAPSPQGGGMVKAAWFRIFMPNERPTGSNAPARCRKTGCGYSISELRRSVRSPRGPSRYR